MLAEERFSSDQGLVRRGKFIRETTRAACRDDKFSGDKSCRRRRKVLKRFDCEEDDFFSEADPALPAYEKKGLPRDRAKLPEEKKGVNKICRGGVA